MNGPMPKTALLITYEYPPSAGGGVQRMAKFAQYLPDFGWRPVVLCAEPIPGRPTDDSLLAPLGDVSVTRIPARHVGTAIAGVLAYLKGSRGASGAVAAADGSASAPVPVSPLASAPVAGARGAEPSAPATRRRVPLSSRLSRLVAVPDDAAYWISAAVREGVQLGREHGVDAVLASGPPHSALVAGARVARTLGVPFVADFRDAWRDNTNAVAPSAWHRGRGLALERFVLTEAAGVVAVSEPIAGEVRELGATRVEVVPNGYDPAEMPQRRPRDDAPLALGFMGRFYATTDPAPLIEAIAALDGQVTLDVAGPPSPLLDAAVSRFAAQSLVRHHGYLEHERALELMATTDVGVVTIADLPGSRAIYTGKLFEYLGMRLPTLVVGPADGAAATLVAEADAGWSVAHGDVDATRALLGRLAADKAAGSLSCAFRTEVLGRFERRTQAGVVAGMLEEAVR